MSDAIKLLNVENFDDFISQGKCIVDFSAEWCGPCKMLTPVFAEVAKEMKDKIKFGRVDVDGQQELAERFGIMSVPALVFFKEGEQVEINLGFADKKKLSGIIKNVF
ncbi:MAG TPA: thioredoxin [Candidatus Nanoarchaeia archaeon]|nr:thioredoxin [Candidatus Nanoarchaeia archaeon]